MNSALTIAKIFFCCFILTSCWTHTIAPLGSSPILGRVVYADLFGLAAIAAFFVAKRFTVGPVGRGAIWFLIFLSPGIAISIRPMGTMLEIGIFAFLTTIFLVGSSAFEDAKDLRWVIRCVAVAALVGAFLGAWENSTSATGANQLFGEDLRNYRGATFRNSGQAGTYLMVCLTMLIPIRYSRLNQILTRADKQLLNVSILASVICVIMTVKIAAFIGLGIGAVGFAALKQRLGFVIPVVAGGIIFKTQSERLKEMFPLLAGRMEYKVSTRLTPEVFSFGGSSSANSFFGKNFSGAWQAFLDNPILGTGIFGFHGLYDFYEVHSTPMKLLGETGLMGCCGYAIFIYSTIKFIQTYKMIPADNPYREYITYCIPFLLGCGVSFMYTWHMRKREFWILLAIVVITTNLMHRTHFSRMRQSGRVRPASVPPRPQVPAAAMHTEH